MKYLWPLFVATSVWALTGCANCGKQGGESAPPPEPRESRSPGQPTPDVIHAPAARPFMFRLKDGGAPTN